MRVPIRKPGKYTFDKPDPHMTQERFFELKEKLAKFRVAQPKAAAEVQRLAQLGDLSENAAYQIAKGKLRSINQKILDLENILNAAVIIKKNSTSEKVKLGSTVTFDLDGKEFTFTILGSSETNPSKGIISHTSPIGKSLMNKRSGDLFVFVIGEEKKKGFIKKIL